MSLVKSKQGTAGLAGSDAKSLQVTVDSQVFAFDTFLRYFSNTKFNIIYN